MDLKNTGSGNGYRGFRAGVGLEEHCEQKELGKKILSCCGF